MQSVVGFVSNPKAAALPDVQSTLRGFVLRGRVELVVHQPQEAQAAWEYIQAQHTLDLPHFQSD